MPKTVTRFRTLPNPLRRRLLCTGLAIVAATLPIGCGTDASGRRRTPDVVDVLHPDASSRLDVAVGQVVAFDLPAHAGTGYEWRAVDSCPEMLQPIDGPVFRPDDPARFGSRGLSRFRYRVVAAGEASLRFDYVRGWDAGSRPVRRSTVEVVAAADG